MKEHDVSKDKGPSAIQEIPLSNVEPLSHTGIYSTVWKANVYEDDSGDSTDVIVKRYDIDPATVGSQLEDWEDYKKIITQYESVTGISIPRTLAFEVQGSSVFFVDELSSSRDLSKMLNDDEVSLDKRHELAATLFESLASIPRDDNHQTAFMIDGKFSNFCMSEDGSISYVDLFPAHARNGASHLLKPSMDHLEQKRSVYTDSFVTGDIYGILGRFMGTLRKDHPDIWATIDESEPMRAAMNGLPQDLKEYCVFLIENDATAVQAVYSFGIQNPDSAQLDAILNPAQYETRA